MRRRKKLRKMRAFGGLVFVCDRWLQCGVLGLSFRFSGIFGMPGIGNRDMELQRTLHSRTYCTLHFRGEWELAVRKDEKMRLPHPL